MSSVRVSMLPLTAYLHIYYVLFYGITNQSSILYVILHLIVSILGDLTFVVLTLMNKYILMPYESNAV